MPDDERQFTGGEDQPPDHPFYGEAGPSDEDIPASLIFMEMMRRAAAQSTPAAPDALPSVDLSKFARKPTAPAPTPEIDAPAPRQTPPPPSIPAQQETGARRAQKATQPLPPAPAEQSHPAPAAAPERPERGDRAARREQRRARMEAAQQGKSALPTPSAPPDLPVEPATPPQPKRERERRLSSTGVSLPHSSDAEQPSPVEPAPTNADDVASLEVPNQPEMRGVWATPTSWRATYDPPEPPKAPAPHPTPKIEAAPPRGETLTPTVAEAVEQERQHEIQRVQRRKRRAAARRRTAVGTVGGVLRAVVLILVSAIMMATIFTWVTSPDLLATNVRQNLSIAAATATSGAAPIVPTALVTPAWAMRVGIVSGHWGPENDPGAVCPDGLTEASINRDVAQKVVVALRGRGYQVDLLDEFDPRLDNYQATALLSIHTNDCRDYGEYVSGYLIAKAAARPDGGEDVRLVECVALSYGQTSGLGRRMGLTVDMTDYHTFREIHPLTPAAILELGFMKDDRAILTEQRDLLVQGIVDGLICYLEGTILPVNAGTPAVLPTMPSPLPPP